MRESYPKPCSEIFVRETRHITQTGSLKQDVTYRDLTLDQKLDEYILQIGYSNAHTMGIVLQLMTRGKIKVEFRKYHERLELLDPNDNLSKGQAITLFDDYIAQMNSGSSDQPGPNVTMKIVIQPRELPQ